MPRSGTGFARRSGAAVVGAALGVLSAFPALAQQTAFQVDFTAGGMLYPPPLIPPQPPKPLHVERPTTGQEAVDTLDTRRREVGNFLACGDEIAFLRNVRAALREDHYDLALDKEASDEGNLTTVLAKQQWLKWNPGPSLVGLAPSVEQADCTRSVLVSLAPDPFQGATGEPNSDDTLDKDGKPDFQLLPQQNYPETHIVLNDVPSVAYADELRKIGQGTAAANLGQASASAPLSPIVSALAVTFGPECANVIQSVLPVDAQNHPLAVGSPTVGDVWRVTYQVSGDCLRAQIVAALGATRSRGRIMGSSGELLCTSQDVLKPTGDDASNWDFSTIVLIRMLYTTPGQMDALSIQRTHVMDDLIKTNIGLGSPYNWMFGCGNSESASGDATERVDNAGGPGALNDLADGLDNLFNWMKDNWFISGPALVALNATPIGPLVDGVLAVAGGDSLAIDQIKVPETENHRLMIESSRYLYDQLLADDLQRDGDDERLDELMKAKAGVHDWLLARLRDITVNDFIEYNAHGYQQKSLRAILNLYDFAGDADVRTAARIVLEWSFAKFAVASRDGRRYVPFRRRMEDVDGVILCPGTDPACLSKRNVLVTGAGADHLVAVGQLYSGQTQQLWQGRVNNEVPSEVVFPAFSSYRPDVATLDLAIDRSTPYMQTIRHDGIEIYSSGKGFLISAGGYKTDYAYSIAGFGDASDIGAALPTVLMIGAGSQRADPFALIRFDGLTEKVQGSKPGSDPQTTRDHNGCVAAGFACGMNAQVPADLAGCFDPPINALPDAVWHFLDTSRCPAFQTDNGGRPYDATNPAPIVYVALLDFSCVYLPDAQCHDFGLMEAVDASEISYDAFQRIVTSGNPPEGIVPQLRPDPRVPARPVQPATYQAHDLRSIAFDVTAHLHDDQKTEILSGGKWKTWPRMAGDILQSTDGSTITIANPRLATKVTLDFADPNHPVFTGSDGSH